MENEVRKMMGQGSRSPERLVGHHEDLGFYSRLSGRHWDDLRRRASRSDLCIKGIISILKIFDSHLHITPHLHHTTFYLCFNLFISFLNVQFLCEVLSSLLMVNSQCPGIMGSQQTC